MDNLARDVKEALRLGYGVHYGRYKVDHPHTRDDSLDIPPTPKHMPKICPECGIEFVPKRSTQQYCTEECKEKRRSKCKQNYKRRRDMNLPIGEAICISCGGKFDRKKKTQETCSRSCAAKLRNVRRYNKNLEYE